VSVPCLAGAGTLDGTDWLPVNAHQAAAAASGGYSLMLLQDPPAMVEDYAADKCAYFQSIGIDQRFWWCD
jgi:hypothetical protein